MITADLPLSESADLITAGVIAALPAPSCTYGGKAKWLLGVVSYRLGYTFSRYLYSSMVIILTHSLSLLNTGEADVLVVGESKVSSFIHCKHNIFVHNLITHLRKL